MGVLEWKGSKRVWVGGVFAGGGGFGLEVVEARSGLVEFLGAWGGFGFVFHAADAGGNEYIPPCDPPGNPVR